MNLRKQAFTLAEVMVVIALLGVVAAITIPSTIKRVKVKANRTKIIKAMAAWEQFVPQFLADNGIFDEAQAANVFNKAPDCNVVTKYFKTYYNKEWRGSCQFTTSDGLLWEIYVSTLDHDNGRPDYHPQGLMANVCFAPKKKNGNKEVGYECKEFILPENGRKYEHFIFYFHYSPEKNALYINDPQNIPWYNWKGSEWCGQHPFGHGCWSALKDYDSKALLPWMYTKKYTLKDKDIELYGNDED